MRKNERAGAIIKLLKAEYPDVKCALTYSQPHELLIATRLSAQCTDVRVNMVTPALFEKYRTVNDFAEADIADVEELIKTCGLYKTKARDIVVMCRQLRDDFGGVVPDTIEALVTLSGVGRKTANLICGDLYHKPTLVCDTHVIRLTNRLGLCKGKDAYVVEMSLAKIIPPEEQLYFCHRLVWHGRQVCNARKPMCEKCVLCAYCAEFIGN